MAKKTKKTAATQPVAETLKQTDTTPTAPVATTSEAPAAQTKPTVDATPTPKGSNIKSAKSTVQNPVQLVHQLVADMKKANPQVTRKELMAACEAKGVAHYTARTQVQRALTALAIPKT